MIHRKTLDEAKLELRLIEENKDNGSLCWLSASGKVALSKENPKGLSVGWRFLYLYSIRLNEFI